MEKPPMPGDYWRYMVFWLWLHHYRDLPAAVFIRSLAQIDPVQIWALFGLAAVPSCFIWHKLVIRLGFRRALTANLLIQAAGVVLPALSQDYSLACSARCWSVLPLWAPLPLRSRKPEG
jgi:hypothetical protein